MTTRVEHVNLSTQRPTAPTRREQSRRLASGLQRLVFALALVFFGLASMYTGVAMLARVYPALFPGKVLFDVPILAQLDSISLGIKTPDDTSVFNQRINLLVLGVDKRAGLAYQPDEGNLTDTIMIATIDPIQKSVALLSLPRDMEIDITLPNGFKYEDRINTSYGVGVKEGKTPDAGFRQIAGDIKVNFGIDIDHWLILDFVGVEKLINSVGGVDVVIPEDLAVPEGWYSNDDEHAIYLAFPPGPVQLDGYRAVAFGRYRETDNDLKRVKRQQLVVMAALGKVFQLGLLNNPLEIWDAYNSTVKTDIPRSRMPGYGLLLKATNGRIKSYSLGDPVNGVDTLTEATSRYGAAVLHWNHENVQYILSQVFTKAKYAASNVEIQNGYGNDDGAVRAGALGRY
ncbi:MAG: LCP family protein, partial [Tepidiformaceae bacterium]